MRDYLSALWSHWVALMSGLAGLLVVMGLRVGRRISPDMRLWPDIPDWLFVGVGIACLLWAGYATWKDTHRALMHLQERLKSPEFSGELDLWSVCPTGSRGQDTFIIVTGYIVNQFGPPSAVLSWSITLVFANSKVMQGVVPLWNHKDIHLVSASTPKKELILDASKYWPAITSELPIPAGGAKTGWFWAAFRDITTDVIFKEEPSIVITFADVVSKKAHKIVRTLNCKDNQPLLAIDDVHNR